MCQGFVSNAVLPFPCTPEKSQVLPKLPCWVLLWYLGGEDSWKETASGNPTPGDLETRDHAKALPAQQAHCCLGALGLGELQEGPPGFGDWGPVSTGTILLVQVQGVLLFLAHLNSSAHAAPKAAQAPGDGQAHPPRSEGNIVIFLFLFLNLIFILYLTRVDLLRGV